MARRNRRRQKGSGSVLETAPGVWAVRWVEGGRRRFRSGFAAREDAEKVLAKIRGEVAQGRAGLPADPAGFPVLSKLADAWLDRRDKTHRAADDDRCRWNKHLGPAFGRLRAAEVDAARIRAFVEAKLAGTPPDGRAAWTPRRSATASGCSRRSTRTCASARARRGPLRTRSAPCPAPRGAS